MNILFINFNIGSTAGINNGIAILSAVLKQRGHRIGLIFLCEEMGYGFDLAQIRQDVERFGPDIIGASLMEPQVKYMAELCDDLRRYYRGMLLAGGPHVTMDPEGILSLPGVNAVIVGEGEDAMVELVQAIEKGGDYSNIRNVWMKSADGSVIRNGLRSFKDLNILPAEDKELFDLERLLPLKNYQLEMMLGRGCVFQCTYCINQSYLDRYYDFCERPVRVKDYIRIKNIETSLKEMKDAITKHPQIRKIAFIDDNFLAYRGFINDFARRYSEEIGLPFMCNANPMSFCAENARILKEAGCDDIRFGIESGSERVKRDIMKRPAPNKSIIDAFRVTKELGLMTSSFNMIGLPTETKDEVFETLRLNSTVLPDTIKVMTFYPFKNTPLYEMCERMNLIDDEKKRQLDDYDTFTCLKFPNGYQLFLKKMQAVFNWYINCFLNNGASAEYKKLIREVESMPEDQWESFDYQMQDRELSEKMRKRGIVHYSKFVNRSLAVKFPSPHLEAKVRPYG